jgi:hypothetical protein
MSQTQKTLGFFISAVASVALALLTWWATQPTPVEGFGLVGEEFFPELDPKESTALRVVVYDRKQGEVQKPFVVQEVEGIWRLPGFHNYPADGEERLADTTTSLIGTKRGSLRSRLASDHVRFGVVNPLETDADILEGHGSRITLYKDGDVEKGIVIADLIIGKKVSDFESDDANGNNDADEATQVADISGDYYVRHPDEAETYVANLNIKLSTKFSDWVEDDLLKTQQDNLTNLELTSRQQAPDRQIEVVTEASLTREKSADPWALAGLNEETEEINEDAIREIVSTLDSLKLSAVRPRPRRRDGEPLLLGDLTLNIPEGVALDAQTERDLQRDIQGNLGRSGFAIYMDSEAGKVQLYSRGGDLTAGEKTGVRYHLSFGESFQGTQEEILVGGEVEETEKSEDSKPDEMGEADDDGKVASRYLIVRATLDESLLGPPLVEPTKPAVPEGVKVDEEGNVVEPAVTEPKPGEANSPETGDKATTPPADKETTKEPADDSSCQEEAPAEKKDGASTEAKEADTEKAPAAKPQETPEEKPATSATPPNTPPNTATTPAETPEVKPDPVAEYKAALSDYRIGMIKYGQDVNDRKEKTAEGKKRVDELNRRFADWYYVITEEDYKKLRRTRDELVKAKEKPAETTEEGSEGPKLEPGRTDPRPAAPDTPEPKPTTPPKGETAPKGETEKKPTPKEAATKEESTTKEAAAPDTPSAEPIEPASPENN